MTPKLPSSPPAGAATRSRCVRALSVLAFLAGACSVGPNYVRPRVETGEAYKEAAGWKRAEPRDTAVRGPWWEAYGDADLSRLEEQALRWSPTLAAADANLRRARALVRGAKAAYYPTATVGLATSRLRGSGNLGTGGSSSEMSFYSAPIDVAWEIDLWGRVRRQVESARAQAEASAADLEAARLSLAAEVAVDYFSLRGLDADGALLAETVQAYERSLRITENRYASGVAARSEVVLATQQLEAARAQQVDVGVLRAKFEHAIAVLVGTVPSQLSLPARPLDAVPLVVPAGLPSQLLERRPDIAAAERRMASANAEIGVAEAAYFPAVTLSASAGVQASHLGDWFAWPSRFWSFGPSVSELVIDGGARKAQTEQARALYDAAVAAYRQSVLTGFQEVEDNLAALRILEEEAEVQRRALGSARESVTLAVNQYKAGTVSYLSVVVVQAARLASERNAVDILARRMVASVLLTKAVGGGWTSGQQVADDASTSHDGADDPS